MRKILLALLVLCSVNAMAQKRLKSFSAPMNYGGIPVNIIGTLNYNENGNPTSFSIGLSISYMGMSQTQDLFNLAYGYSEDSLSQSMTINDGESVSELFGSTATLSDGLTKSLTYTADGKSYSYDFTYTDGLLTNVSGDNEDGQQVDEDIYWTDGNVSSVASFLNGDSATLTTLEYGDVKSAKGLDAIVAIVAESQMTDNAFVGYTPVKNYGLSTKNLPIKITTVDKLPADTTDAANTDDTNDASDDNGAVTFDYTVGDDGYPSQVAVNGLNLELDEETSINSLNLNLEWEDDPSTGIGKVVTSKQNGSDSYFSINGTQLQVPQRGLNIIRHADGTVRKVIIK